MSRLLPGDDDQLLAELGEALQSVGPITEDDLTRARLAYTWRTVDDELAFATLVYDSSIQDRPLMRSSAGSDGRTLVFECDTVSVELDATPDALLGRVVPPGRADISLVTPSGRVGETTADDMGSFMLAAAPAGPVRLLCRTAGTRLATEWVRL